MPFAVPRFSAHFQLPLKIHINPFFEDDFSGGDKYSEEIGACQKLRPPEADAARQDLLRLDIVLFAFEPLADRIWQLRNNLSSYDTWYVAVAEALNAPMATLDLSLLRASGPLCQFLTPT